LGAESGGVLSQRDTYFNAVNGRLKLREMEGEAQLIAYERSDDVGHRTSSYRIVEVEDAGGLRDALADGLGIQAIVAKKRSSSCGRTYGSISTMSKGSATSSSSKRSPHRNPTYPRKPSEFASYGKDSRSPTQT
jgi:hypothetical protein